MEVVDTEQYGPLEALSESAPPRENCGGSSAFVVLCWLRATSSEWLRRGAAGVWYVALSSADCSSGAKRIRREWVYSVSWSMISWFINTGTLCSTASVPICMVDVS